MIYQIPERRLELIRLYEYLQRLDVDSILVSNKRGLYACTRLLTGVQQEGSVENKETENCTITVTISKRNKSTKHHSNNE